MCIGHDIIAIIPNESIVVSDYLFHFFKWYQINKERRHILRLIIELPPLDIQHRAQLLNAIQHLLMNKDSLVTAVEKLPQYFDNVSKQVNQHSKTYIIALNSSNIYMLICYIRFIMEIS